MKRALRAGVAAVVVLALAGPAVRAADQDAIDKAVAAGVKFLRDAPNAGVGGGAVQQVGATALVGLTLLECGVAPDDKAVQAAVATVRQASPTVDQTYSLALSILLLDRLGDPDDVPLIESMTVRLLAGQNADGAWSYNCPGVADSELRRLATHLREQTELTGRRDPPMETEKDKDGKAIKRSVKDLPKEIQDQLAQINRVQAAAGIPGPSGDNSNTQFATVALWVARRHGLPVDTALARIDRRYRTTQNGDGGWWYTSMPTTPGALGMAPRYPSTATMTCAGLLGLAVAQGVVADSGQENGKSGPDLSKDRALKAALTVLATAIGDPVAKRKVGDMTPAIPMVGGKTYYFFWSLERVAVALDLDTIGGKDWYDWGSEILVANQGPGGAWQGEYQPAVDTCFALLFLKRANLTRDLTGALKGKLGGVTFKAGGVGGEALHSLEGLETKDKDRPAHGDPGTAVKPPKDPAESRPPAEETEGGRMARELVQAAAERRDQLLENYREGKGVTYTEALAGAIPQMTGEDKRKAREALADRLTRMKPETLARYFGDGDAEIRRAAAVAAAQRESKSLIPDLIPLLNDAEPSVARAAHAALKDLTGERLGPSADEWKAWWKKQDPK